MNPDGTLIATASIKGTKLKVFSADNEKVTPLQVLRRGTQGAVISSIVFHPTQNLLACCSSKSSIHIFSTADSIKKCIENKYYGFQDSDMEKAGDVKNAQPR